MSEQTKSGVRMIGAGVMGFVAVVAVGGLILARDPGRGSPPGLSRAQAPAAAMDLVIPRAAPAHEPRQSSPAPLMGSVAGDIAPEGAAPQAAASSPAASSPASGAALGAMGEPRLAGKGESSASARAQARQAVAAASAPRGGEAPAPKPVPRRALESRASIASAVHYGVTSRDQLMGKAAGPVYNFSGRKVAGDPRLAELASRADAQMSIVEEKIDRSELTAEQKAEMKRRLKLAGSGQAK